MFYDKNKLGLPLRFLWGGRLFRLEKRNSNLTWEWTTTPSLVKRRSVSIACAPTSTAPLNALIVFSGYVALYPRWAIAWGRFPCGVSFANVKKAFELEADLSARLDWRKQLLDTYIGEFPSSSPSSSAITAG